MTQSKYMHSNTTKKHKQKTNELQKCNCRLKNKERDEIGHWNHVKKPVM